MQEEIAGGRISFVTQRAPIDERGRAMYAVSRSILRALIDQLSAADLTVLNTDKSDVTLRQLSMLSSRMPLGKQCFCRTVEDILPLLTSG